MLALVKPKIKPIRDAVVIKYKLTDLVANKVYPKTKDGIINMSEDDLLENPNLEIAKSFEELIKTPEFTYVVFSRLGRLWEMLEAEIVRDFDNEENNRKVLLNLNLGYVFVGSKYFPDYANNQIYSITNKNNLMAEIIDKKNYKPFGDRVELEFDLPPAFKREIEALDINLEEGELVFLNALRTNPQISDESLKTPFAVVSAVGDEVKDLKVGDKVIVSLGYDFALKTLTRIDLEKNKAYYIKDAKLVLGIVDNNSIIEI